MQQVLFIGGGNVYRNREDFVKQLKTWDNNPFDIKKKWKYTLSKDLGECYQVAMIDMPNKNVASYVEWRIWFEKVFPFLEGDQIIIAHSLGTIFILKYLIENGFPKKIKQLHLVAALIDDKGMPSEESYLGDFLFDIERIPEIENYCDKVFLYHSKDDSCVPFSQGERLYEFLPSARFEVFEGRGHMNMEEFPELIQNIKNN